MRSHNSGLRLKVAGVTLLFGGGLAAALVLGSGNAMASGVSGGSVTATATVANSTTFTMNTTSLTFANVASGNPASANTPVTGTVTTTDGDGVTITAQPVSSPATADPSVWGDDYEALIVPSTDVTISGSTGTLNGGVLPADGDFIGTVESNDMATSSAGMISISNAPSLASLVEPDFIPISSLSFNGLAGQHAFTEGTFGCSGGADEESGASDSYVIGGQNDSSGVPAGETAIASNNCTSTPAPAVTTDTMSGAGTLSISDQYTLSAAPGPNDPSDTYTVQLDYVATPNT